MLEGSRFRRLLDRIARFGCLSNRACVEFEFAGRDRRCECVDVGGCTVGLPQRGRRVVEEDDVCQATGEVCHWYQTWSRTWCELLTQATAATMGRHAQDRIAAGESSYLGMAATPNP